MDVDFEDGRAWMIGSAEYQASARRQAAERQSPPATKLELRLQALHTVATHPQPLLAPQSQESITSVIVVMIATLSIAAGLLLASLISAQA
jgi:hypothetical protein